ncbi:MAG TPA: prephenate dehydrogenase [Candidatus Deferrimicrobium sp.]|nr:prephenate dehydrogenase [Candidatus Deferrimicrobium sp.]
MKRLEELVVLIVGLGQIGGSMGLDLVRKRTVARVIGFDRNPRVRRRAVSMNVVHSSVNTLAQGVREADLLILAIPIREIISLIPSLTKMVDTRRDTCILDVAGTKTEIFKALSKAGGRLNYISGHPITGSEKSGLDSVRPNLLADASFVLVPHRQCQKRWLTVAKRIVRALGARPILMTAQQHDRLIALTSGLPHVMALALTNLAVKSGKTDGQIRNLIGGSFKSATRVAASPPDLIVDMLLTNRDQVSPAIEALIEELSKLKRAIDQSDEALCRALIRRVHARSLNLNRSRGR